MLVVALLVGVVGVGGLGVGQSIAGAQEAQAPDQTDQTVVTTTTVPSADGVGSILGPRPGAGKPPEDAGDRGGSAQVATFWVIVVALGGLAFLVVRDIKKSKARRGLPGMDIKPDKTPSAGGK